MDSALSKVNKGLVVMKTLRHLFAHIHTRKVFTHYLQGLQRYCNSSFCEKLKSAQYKATLAVTVVMQVTSSEKSIQ